ncbi:GDSL-type esterase/lipase family protein [Paenibacillus provencensis]|uniref:GDSL-type esterase/lipase family protein n=1 Tax=Paenibacillus provencensis TaxID=441151 RepID=A0ABW3QEC2_9BACL|nr:GDSL-type esterase/lipase family protein [Paenibacillus sp. MER 78]MCM3129495.1 GDSL-type esterase/lipase family protein [Paenibacillus sp. MER 78]
MMKIASFRRRIKQGFVLLFAGGLFLYAWHTAVYAQEVTSKEPFKIVALGDSITVGYEPGMEDYSTAPYGYVERLLEQGLLHERTVVTNYGIGGLKSNGLKEFAQAIFNEETVTPEEIQPGLPDARVASYMVSIRQIKQDVTEADVITITIGGNDVSELLVTADGMNDSDLNQRVEEMLAKYTLEVTAAVQQLHAMNSNAMIVLADQYQPVPKVGNAGLYAKLMEASAEFTRTVDALAAELSTQGVPIKVAHIAQAFAGGEGTMTHMIGSRDFHPNQLGYEAIAKVFAESIWGQYVKLKAAETGEPMNIIVSGKLLDTPYKPVLRNNQNYVAIQDIVSAVGAKSQWIHEAKATLITYNANRVQIQINKPNVLVNGQLIPVKNAPFLHQVGKEAKTYVPLALIAEGLGYDVQYNAKLKTVFINP